MHYTQAEVKKEFIGNVQAIVNYWNSAPDLSDRCHGVAFSILNLIDGYRGMPSIDLVLRPHTEDKEFSIENGEKYYQDGMVINNDAMLHEEFLNERR